MILSTLLQFLDDYLRHSSQITSAHSALGTVFGVDALYKLTFYLLPYLLTYIQDCHAIQNKMSSEMCFLHIYVYWMFLTLVLIFSSRLCLFRNCFFPVVLYVSKQLKVTFYFSLHAVNCVI